MTHIAASASIVTETNEIKYLLSTKVCQPYFSTNIIKKSFIHIYTKNSTIIDVNINILLNKNKLKSNN